MAGRGESCSVSSTEKVGEVERQASGAPPHSVRGGGTLTGRPVQGPPGPPECLTLPFRTELSLSSDYSPDPHPQQGLLGPSRKPLGCPLRVHRVQAGSVQQSGSQRRKGTPGHTPTPALTKSLL